MYQITIEQIAGDRATRKHYMIDGRDDAQAWERANAQVHTAGFLATLVSVKRVETGH